MSLENSIALLTAQTGLLLDLPQQIATQANGKIDSLTDRFGSILASANLALYVNQVAGSDANEGTQASPLKTIQAAINQCPRGGIVRVVLMNDYVVEVGGIFCAGRRVTIMSWGTRRRLDFQGYATGTVPIYRAVYGFNVHEGGSLGFYNIRIAIPPLAAAYAALPLANGCVINHETVDHWIAPQVAFFSCDIDIPATPFCPLFNGANCWIASFAGVTFPGAVTSPLGRLFLDQTNTAGVAVTSLPWLLCNLPNV